MLDSQAAAALMDNLDFQARVRQCMTAAALVVVNENKSGKPIVDQKRHDLAVEVLRKPTVETEMLFRRTAAALTTGATDAEVLACFQTSANWNKMSGVCGLDG